MVLNSPPTKGEYPKGEGVVFLPPLKKLLGKIGGSNGNMYGYVKDASNPMKTLIPSKTKLDNLYLTGQSINMHGVLGVTIGAVVTCSEIVGKEYLVTKINQASE